jgi:Uma2 family endonuclease
MPVLSNESDPDVIDGVYYPSSDGKPMAETFLHVLAIFEIFELLRERYRDRNVVYIAADMFWYWERGNPSACVAPDLMVNFGVPEGDERRSFKTWIENGVVPSVTFEMASKGTWRKNVGKTRDTYERLGVKEYFIFDPEDKYLETQLLGFRLRSKKYVAIAAKSDGSMLSQVLGLKLTPEGRHLRLADIETGERLLTPAEREARRAEEERRRADELAEENARLRAQLRQRQNGKNGGAPATSA